MLPSYSSKNYPVSQEVRASWRPASRVLYTSHMRVAIHHHFWPFVRRRFLVIAIVGVLTSATVFGIQWHTASVEASIVSRQQELSTRLAQLDEEIKTILARKAEEARLKKAEEARLTAEAIAASPTIAPQTIDSTTCNVSGQRTDASRVTVLVNKKHCIQPLDYYPADLVTVYGATISAKAAADFTALFDAATAAGQGLSATSSYRSYATQVNTYNYWVTVSGVAGADQYSARPGYSEHQTGFAVDFATASGSCSLDCFGTTTQYQWLQANAAIYGFIQRYYAGQ